MARKKFRQVVRDTQGDAVASADVEVRNAAGNLATLYAGETGATTLANPMTAGDGGAEKIGAFEFWIDEADYGTFSITVGAGASADTFPTVIEDAAASVAAISERVDAVEAGQVSGYVSTATWTALQAITPTEDATGAEVLDSDTGTHSAASGTGYDGATVNNAGRYSWSAPWGRWVRIGDTGLAGLDARLDAVEAEKAPLANPSFTGTATLDGDDLVTEPELAAVAAAEALNTAFRGGIEDVINVDQPQPDPFYLTDAVGRVLLQIKSDGTIIGPFGAEIGAGGAAASGTNLYSRGQLVSLASQTVTSSQIQFSFDIYGYTDGETRTTATITNQGLTHPKVLHIPGGWHGYEYWMAVTPYFIGTFGSESENPHILASNDGVSWVEVPDGPIDMADESPMYFSDTHLLLGDDGWMYCYYRGVSFPDDPLGPKLYYQRSRNGVDWSGRTLLITSLNTVSPVVAPSPRGGYDFFEVCLSGSGTAFESGKRELSRRWSSDPTTFPARDNADICTIVNRPWDTEYTNGETDYYDLWHVDVDRIGNLWVGVLCIRRINSTGPILNYLMTSPSGWTWTVIPGAIGASHYRSCVVPVSWSEGQAVVDLYMAAQTGVISLQRAVLEVL